jgi:hypothetical protein
MKKEIDDIQINNLILRETLKGNPFLVPDDYFSILREEIIFKKNISKLGESSFIVPQDYQKNLNQDILSKISEERIKEFLPAHEPAVPTGYFNDLQARIINKTIRANEVDMPFTIDSELIENEIIDSPIKRLRFRKWLPYAVAASVAIILGLFTILDGEISTNDQTINYSAQIDSVPTDEIISYLAYYSEAGDLLYLSEQLNDLSVDITENLSSQEIEAYLEYGI